MFCCFLHLFACFLCLEDESFTQTVFPNKWMFNMFPKWETAATMDFGRSFTLYLLPSLLLTYVLHIIYNCIVQSKYVGENKLWKFYEWRHPFSRKNLIFAKQQKVQNPQDCPFKRKAPSPIWFTSGRRSWGAIWFFGFAPNVEPLFLTADCPRC